MRAFLLAVLAIVFISAGAWYVLDEAIGFSTAEDTASPNVRLD